MMLTRGRFGGDRERCVPKLSVAPQGQSGITERYICWKHLPKWSRISAPCGNMTETRDSHQWWIPSRRLDFVEWLDPFKVSVSESWKKSSPRRSRSARMGSTMINSMAPPNLGLNCRREVSASICGVPTVAFLRGYEYLPRHEKFPCQINFFRRHPSCQLRELSMPYNLRKRPGFRGLSSMSYVALRLYLECSCRINRAFNHPRLLDMQITQLL